MDDKLVRLGDVLESANRHRMYASANRESVNSFVEFIKEIDSIPAVDAVEVVRCGECAHWERLKRMKWYGTCQNGLHDIDYFCADGQSREVVNNETD